MKRFNLEEYKKDTSREITTLNNDVVRIVCIDRKDGLYPIVALIKDKLTGDEKVCFYTDNGRSLFEAPSITDLYFASKKITRWQNIYKCCGRLFGGHLYKYRVLALEAKTPLFFKYVTTAKVEWLED